MPVAANRGGGSTNSRGGQRNPGVQPQLWNLIRAYSQRLNLDPYAVAAVSRVEGGGRFGEVGDGGTSYGPFQLHVGGALPPGRDAAWANSPAGVLYAMQHMAASGAAGLRGLAAVRAIVTRFERPAQPGAEVTSAFAGYRSFGGGLPGGLGSGMGQAGQGLNYAALQSQLQQQSRLFAAQQAQLLQSLRTQAAQARQQSLVAGIQQEAQQRVGAAQLAQQGVSGGGVAPGGVPALGLYDQQKSMLDQIRNRALARAGLYAG